MTCMTLIACLRVLDCAAVPKEPGGWPETQLGRMRMFLIQASFGETVESMHRV